MIISPAREAFTQVMREVVALCKFRETQRMQRGAWDAQVPDDIKARLIKWEYVRVDKYVVYITCTGLEVIGYTEATA
jgi:hypothetical protein